jgi:hypothetical protein
MKKAKRRKQTVDSTPRAVALAALFGAAALSCAEMIYDNIKDFGVSEAPPVALWRAHMASGCVGSITFVASLFLLERLGRRSGSMALRNAAPWLPIVALTALATAIHIPILLVICLAAIYSPWAYSLMRVGR